MMQLNSKKKKIFAIVWAWIEIFLFAGMFFGWGSLTLMLKEDGVYGYLCTKVLNHTDNPSYTYYEGSLGYNTSFKTASIVNKTYNTVEHAQLVKYQTHYKQIVGCPKQDKVYSLGFAVASGTWPYYFGIVSHLGHRFGTRFIRIVSSSSFIIGSFLVAFTNPDVPFLVFLGIFLFGMSGCGLLFSNLQLSYLFRRGRTIVCGLMTGAFDSSIATQLYLKLAYDAGVQRKHCYIFLGCAHMVTFISTFLWLPRTYIKLPETTEEVIEVEDVTDRRNEIEQSQNQQSLIHKDKKDDGPEEEESTRPLDSTGDDSHRSKATLKRLFLSPVYMLHIFWYSVLQLRFLYFVSTLNPWLERISDSEEEVSQLTNVSMYCMMGGIATSFIAGTFFDCQKERYKDSKSELRRHVGPVVLPLVAGSVLGIFVSVMQMIPNKVAVYAAFVSLTIFRSFLYAIGNGYLSAMFPSKFFSALSGLLMILTGSACFFQYALFSWTESYSGAYMHVDVFLLCMVLTSLIHPIYHWWKCKNSAT